MLHRNLSSCVTVPIIAITAAPPDKRTILGDIRVIRKPINLDELRYAMAQVL